MKAEPESAERIFWRAGSVRLGGNGGSNRNTGQVDQSTVIANKYNPQPIVHSVQPVRNRLPHSMTVSGLAGSYVALCAARIFAISANQNKVSVRIAAATLVKCQESISLKGMKYSNTFCPLSCAKTF